MKRSKFISLFVMILLIAGFAVYGHHGKDKDTLYQVSILGGLMKGDYVGKVALDEIRRHGDFGIGTFDRLDGEAVELDGRFYRIASNGAVDSPSGGTRSPFAMTTFFDTLTRFPAAQVSGYRSLQEAIDGHLPTRNIPYAIRIDGKFGYVKTRSVPAQNKPYPPLTEVTQHQNVFELRNIEGTLVGFRIPDYMQGVNMPGYHMHFLSADRTMGGHVLECTVDSADVKIDDIDSFIMALPGSPDFYRMDLLHDTGGYSAAEK